MRSVVGAHRCLHRKDITPSITKIPVVITDAWQETGGTKRKAQPRSSKMSRFGTRPYLWYATKSNQTVIIITRWLQQCIIQAISFMWFGLRDCDSAYNAERLHSEIWSAISYHIADYPQSSLFISHFALMTVLWLSFIDYLTPLNIIDNFLLDDL